VSIYDADAEIQLNWLEKQMSKLMAGQGSEIQDPRSEKDWAAYDLHIDGALELNKTLAMPENIYSFSIPCSASKQNPDGTWSPIRSRMELFFRVDSERIGHSKGVTDGGFVFDESWQQNDGLVNTVSAMAPMGQPSAAYDPEKIEPGSWNIFPVYEGDHMSLQGGMMKRNDVRALYAELLDRINCIGENEE
jgi:hypothetical protein